MAVLPMNVKSWLIGSSSSAHKRHLQTIKGNIAASSAYVRGVSVKQSDEPTPEAGRAIDKVLRLPRTRGGGGGAG